MKITALDIYKFCDYVPIVSVFTNVSVLCGKAVIFFERSPEIPAPGSFRAYVAEKKVLRCIILILLPGVGNIVFAIYDLFVKTGTPQPVFIPQVPQSVVDLPIDVVMKPQEVEPSAHLATQTDVPRPTPAPQISQIVVDLPIDLPVQPQQIEPSVPLADSVLRNSHIFQLIAPYLANQGLVSAARLNKSARNMMSVFLAKHHCRHLFPLTFFSMDRTRSAKYFLPIVQERQATLRSMQATQWKVAKYHHSRLFWERATGARAFHVTDSHIACYLYSANRVEVYDRTTKNTQRIVLNSLIMDDDQYEVRVGGRMLVTFHQQKLNHIHQQKLNHETREGEVLFSSLDTGQEVRRMRANICDIACSEKYIAIWPGPLIRGNERIVIFDAQTGNPLSKFIPDFDPGMGVRQLAIVGDYLIAFRFVPYGHSNIAKIFDLAIFCDPSWIGTFSLEHPQGCKIMNLNENPEKGFGTLQKGSERELALVSDPTGMRLVNLLNGKNLAKIDTVQPPFDDMQLVGNQILFTQPESPNIMALTPVLPNPA